MLKGQKVILRAMERSDLDRLHRFNNNIDVELAGGGDPPMPQSMARLEAEFDSRASGGGRDDATFAIVVDELFIGICALFNVDQTAHTCELGITIGDPNYWGQGYGSETVALLVKYGFRYRNYHKIYLRVHGKNIRAQKAYQSAGFVEEGRLRQHIYSDGAYDDLIHMGILRSDWLESGK